MSDNDIVFELKELNRTLKLIATILETDMKIDSNRSSNDIIAKRFARLLEEYTNTKTEILNGQS